jgi:hypothetical protein
VFKKYLWFSNSLQLAAVPIIFENKQSIKMTPTDFEDSSFWVKSPEVGSSETIEESDFPDVDERVILICSKSLSRQVSASVLFDRHNCFLEIPLEMRIHLLRKIHRLICMKALHHLITYMLKANLIDKDRKERQQRKNKLF